MTKRYIAVVPARSGSKGLPGKNKKLLAGKPLILHTVDAAIGTGTFSDIIVTTDDRDIITLLNNEKYENVTVDKRPKNLASDNTEMYEVIEYLIDNYKLSSNDFLILLQPTSPLRDDKDIINAINKFEESDSSALISVTESDNTVLKHCIFDGELLVGIRTNDLLFKNRQSLPKTYKPNGAIYIYKAEDLIKNRGFHLDKTTAYIMDKKISLDIDDINDFEKLEGILK
jgi:CMP-N,N'-diacetyllegionaminic acid synthase